MNQSCHDITIALVLPIEQYFKTREFYFFSGIPEEKKVRCVLFWRTEHTHEAHELSYALIRHYEQVVVAGGYVDQFIPEDEVARVNDE